MKNNFSRKFQFPLTTCLFSCKEALDAIPEEKVLEDPNNLLPEKTDQLTKDEL